VPRERDLSGPPKVTAELVALGHEKFNQICSPCHGLAGDGTGSIAHKMSLRQPPSLHDTRRRALTSEWIFRAISEGYGLMPRFTTQLDARERWAVVSYVRALQRSQDVAYDALPADLREELDHPKPKAPPPGEEPGEGKEGHGEGHGHHAHGAPAEAAPPAAEKPEGSEGENNR
jgi:mono/diheme cytochrome c family protein